jgi:hypothetical protein
VYVSLRDRDQILADKTASRLEDEFFAELRAHGTVRLPEPSSLEPVTAFLGRIKDEMTEAERKAWFGPGPFDRMP